MIEKLNLPREGDVSKKLVLLRVDYNVPINNLEGVLDDTKIVASLPTINFLVKSGARLVIMSHLGRVDRPQADYSLKKVAFCLKKYLRNIEVKFVGATQGEELENQINKLISGQILIMENTRFEGKAETQNDPKIAKYWARLFDVVVFDAFAASHRKHASTCGIVKYAKKVFVGQLFEKEINYLFRLKRSPERPFVVVMGGAKVADKISLLQSFCDISDNLLVGGGIANTIFLAKGYKIGCSLADKDPQVLKKVSEIWNNYQNKIVTPVDGIVTDIRDSSTREVFYGNYQENNLPITEHDDILDIGTETVKRFKPYIQSAKTIFWNGPMGLFEDERYKNGTSSICKLVSNLDKNTITIIGGGESAAAIKKFGNLKNITHISTGGGASLVYLSKNELPVIKEIRNRS